MNFLVRGVIGLMVFSTVPASADWVETVSGQGPLDGTAWVLMALVGHEATGHSAATLQFAGGRLSGSDGCNRFGGSYTATATAFEVSSPLVSTQMACPPEVEAQARAFLAALTAAKGYRIEDASLVLLSAESTPLATLAAQSRALAGTSWRATGINNGRQAVASVVNGTSVTLSFGADGNVSGSGGCNHYSGHYEATGSRLSIGKFAVTAMACADPPGVMEQEQAFLKALGSASSVRFEGDRMELRTSDGALAASFARASGG